MIDILRLNTPLGNRDNYDELEQLQPGRNQEENRLNATRLILLGILYVVPIYAIAYGAVHLHDCPAQNMLPIGMIVIGALALLIRFLSIPVEFRWAFCAGDGATTSLTLICINMVLQTILLFWFFALCYWVYSIKPDTKHGSHDLPNYCDEYFYRGAFWGATVFLIFLGLFIVLLCGGAFYVVCNDRI